MAGPKRMTFTLVDDPDPRRTLKGVAQDDDGSVFLYVDGYGEGDPIAALVFQDGRLRLLAWPDPDGDARILDLESARPIRKQDWRPNR